MREILFRGKRLDNGEWIEGLLMAFSPRIAVAQIGTFTDFGHYVRCDRSLGVDINTVGQYTGLTDKNGKRIFEGDIVQDISLYLTHCAHVESGRETREQAEAYKDAGDIGVVIFSTEDIGSCGCCYPQFEGTGFTAGSGVRLSCCKVIGNNYDNPELLERGS